LQFVEPLTFNFGKDVRRRVRPHIGNIQFFGKLVDDEKRIKFANRGRRDVSIWKCVGFPLELYCFEVDLGARVKLSRFLQVNVTVSGHFITMPVSYRDAEISSRLV